MLVSYTWLQTYFDAPLPPVDELTDLLTMGVFEIEGVEKKGDDTVIDVKVLPDRAPYGYSHRYIAQEVGALTNQPVKFPAIAPFAEGVTARPLDISIIMKPDAERAWCKRYIGRVIEGVAVDPSPLWLSGMLEALGQRSINSIVDLTNYVMLETGQPLHAFDADKVDGDIQVRLAREGEKLTLLDGTEIALAPTMLVIADSVGPLALAGVKGGKRAEISADTKNIILESACFDSTLTRKTAQAVGIRNESSKRFENGVTPERAGLAMAMISSHVAALNPEAVIGPAVDVYPVEAEDRMLGVSMSAINDRLGLSLSAETMSGILLRLGLASSVHEEDADILNISVPPYRPDLVIMEDIAEEIGRVNGYARLGEVIPPARPDRQVQKNFYYFNLIRRLLAEIGFSEVYTYSLIDRGDMAIINPLTVERAFMRNSISELLRQKFLFNLRNVDLLGQKDVRLFEIGKVFGGKIERNSLAFGVGQMKLAKGQDPKAEAMAIASHVFHHLGADDAVLRDLASKLRLTELSGDAHISCVGFVAELDIDPIMATLPDPKHDVVLGRLVDSLTDGRKFKAISLYPFSSRDVAVFVPGEAGREDEVIDSIKGALKALPFGSGSCLDILARSTLFDVFTKNREGEPVKTSYGYRLVFQSPERTLTEEEVSSCMKAVFSALSAQDGWEVR